MKKLVALLFTIMLMALCACGAEKEKASEESGQTFELKAGDSLAIYGETYDTMVTIIVDPASTRDGTPDLRSDIAFDNCVFNGGLTVVGDFHAMVSLGYGTAFGKDSIITCKSATKGIEKEITLDDNLVKIFAGCEGVTVEAETAIGVVTAGNDFVLNGTTYSKAEISPDSAFLGVYSIYEGDSVTYPKLAIEEDDTIEVIE